MYKLAILALTHIPQIRVQHQDRDAEILAIVLQLEKTTGMPLSVSVGVVFSINPNDFCYIW